MTLKRFIHSLLCVVLFLLCSSLETTAQSVIKQSSEDSAAVKKRIENEYKRRDSIFAAMREKRVQDSLNLVNQKKRIQEYRDSLAAARIAKRKADSVARVEAKLKLIREQNERDSLAAAVRKRQSDSLLQAKIQADKLREEEMRQRDSLTAARKRYSDSVKIAREKANKLREELDKYRNSKRYKDSVEAAKQARKDSLASIRKAEQDKIMAERQRVNDSIRLAREQYNDSLKIARENYNDSVKTARDKIKDSMLAARKLRMDSLAAVRKQKEKDKGLADAKTKDAKNKKLAVQIHEKKMVEWSNEKLLKRKWSLPRRIYQNTVTRYNYYYNARRKYNDAIRTLTKNHKEDYTKPISIYPYDPLKLGPSVGSEMDTVIKKCSFSTQIHDPRSKWFDNLYLLMGKASFVKNDFEGAISTLQFVANEYKDLGKKKNSKTSTKKSIDTSGFMSIATPENRKGIRALSHKLSRNEALIWLGKAYMAAEQHSEAMALYTTLEKDPNLPKKYKPALYLAKAQLELEQQNGSDAIVSLEKSLKYSMSKLQRSRVNFALGQLYAQQGDFSTSTARFKKSISGKTNPDMDFYTKLFMAQNAAQGGGDKSFAKHQLQKLVNDPKYTKFKSLALNTLAGIEAMDDVPEAIRLLNKSITNPENKDVTVKAKAFAELGRLYYQQTEYELAKMAYDSASYFGTTPPLDNIDLVNTRKTVLTEVVKYRRIIREQDSLLDLSKKSEKEQKAAAKKALERQKKLQNAQPDQNTKVVALQAGNSKSNWYFYNNSIIQKGSQEFEQKWGKRKLEDNWRRSASTMAAASESESEDDTEDGKTNAGDIATMLKALPKTPAQLDACLAKISEAYYNLGLTYYSQLEDYPNAIQSFDTLLSRFPNTPNKKQTYYALFLNHDKLKNVQKAEYYKSLLNGEFQGSELAELAKNPEYKNPLAVQSQSAANHYESTYNFYKAGSYNEALSGVNLAKTQYKGHELMPKFQLVEAISFAGLKQLDTCKSLLKQIIADYPNSDEQKRAQEILNLIASSQNGEMGDSAVAGTVAIQPNQSKTLDSLEFMSTMSELVQAEGKGVFTFDPSSAHLVMVFLRNADGRTMGLKAGISDYNLLRHNVEEYSTGLNMLTAQQAIITIHDFANSIFAKKYMNEFKDEKLLFGQLKSSEYEICLISKSNYQEVLKSRDILGYMKFFKKNYK